MVHIQAATAWQDLVCRFWAMNWIWVERKAQAATVGELGALCLIVAARVIFSLAARGN